MSTLSNLAYYWDQLNRFDWYYDFSDDHNVWTSGQRRRAELKVLAKTSPEHQALFDGFAEHYFSGDAWNTKQVEKPARPRDPEDPCRQDERCLNTGRCPFDPVCNN